MSGFESQKSPACVTPEPQLQQEISWEGLGEAADLRGLHGSYSWFWAAEQGSGKGREA